MNRELVFIDDGDRQSFIKGGGVIEGVPDIGGGTAGCDSGTIVIEKETGI